MCPSAQAAPAPAAWQVQDGSNLTVITEGDRSQAERAFVRVRQLQAAAAWLLDWPSDFKAPPALLFVLERNTVLRVFGRPKLSEGSALSPSVAQGSVLATPSFSLVVAPLDPLRAAEFEPVQDLYGEVLVELAPVTNGWSACPRTGLRMLLVGAEFSEGNHLYIAGDRLLMTHGALSRPASVLRPADFLDPSLPGLPHQADMDARAYSCYVLSRWYQRSSGEDRAAFGALFRALGSGTPLQAAIPAGLGSDLADFSARYLRFANDFAFLPRRFDIRIELPLAAGATPEPSPVSPERLQALLQQLCAKLNTCTRP